MQKPKVVYWNSQPTPYMVERWNRIVERGNIDFQAWFNVERESDRSWAVDERSWKFKGTYLDAHTIVGRKLFLPPALSPQDQPDLIVQEYATPSMVLGFFISRGIAKRVSFRALPTYDTWVRRSRSKELAKHLLFRSVDATKTAGPAGIDMVHRYGLARSRIYPVTQSIDFSHFATASRIDPRVREKRRQELGLNDCTFIYVGRLWTKKGLDTLFDAFSTVAATIPDVSLLVVGDGKDEVHYRERAGTMPDVHFLGFVQRDLLPSVLALAEVFVFPTLGDPHGLVVEEAMAAGLPVISSDAAGDIERRLPNGEAGYIVPAASATALAEKMIVLARDHLGRKHMAMHAQKVAGTRDHDVYAGDFERFVDSILHTPPSRHPLAVASRGIGLMAARLNRSLGGP